MFVVIINWVVEGVFGYFINLVFMVLFGVVLLWEWL